MLGCRNVPTVRGGAAFVDRELTGPDQKRLRLDDDQGQVQQFLPPIPDAFPLDFADAFARPSLQEPARVVEELPVE